MIFKEYYNTEEFAILANIDKKTVGRLKKRLLQENPITSKVKHKSVPHKYHHSLLKRYLSPQLYTVLLENKSLTNTIKCLKKPDTLGYKLFQMDWTWWCTVAYKDELSTDACRKYMDNFYNHMQTTYGNDTDLRMYYTTESFSSRDGNHNHFVLNVTETNLHYEIKQDVESFFQDHRVDIQHYNENLPCIFYSEKDGLQGTAWDVYGNNLIQDGIQYESKDKRASI